MADLKTNQESEVLYAGLLAKHILRGASDNASGNFYIYFSKLIAGIAAGVTYTVAEAQAAAIALEFIPGQRVTISNPLGDTNNEFRTIAKSTSELENLGAGTYQGAAMTGPLEFTMKYDLTADHFSYLYNEKYDNEITQIGYNFIGSLQLDGEDTGRAATGTLAASTFKHNRLRNCTLSIGSGHCEIRNSSLFTAVLTMTFNGSTDTCAIYESDVFNATISMFANAGSFTAFTLGSRAIGSILFDFRAAQTSTVYCFQAELHGEAIGTAIFLDTSSLPPGYIGYGRYNYQGSTFYISGAFNTEVNPDAGGSMNFIKCPWVGAVEITDTGTSGGVAVQINSHSGIKMIIYVNSGAGTPLVFTDASISGGNISTPLGSAITLDPTKGDRLDVSGKIAAPGNYAVQSFATYV